MTTFSRTWLYSQSCKPITGFLAVVDILGDVAVTDSVYGATAYSLQMNIAMDDGWLFQPVYANFPTMQVWEGYDNLGTGGISDSHYGYLFPQQQVGQPLLKAGTGLLMSIAETDYGFSGLLWMRKNRFLHGMPIYLDIPGKHRMVDVAFDICAIGGGGTANFTSAAFDVELKLQGVDDLAYWGQSTDLSIGPNWGPALPSGLGACNTPYILNTAENSNLVQAVVDSEPADGWLHLRYGV